LRRIARYSVMRLNVLLFAAGVCLLQQQAQLPESPTAWLLAALGIAVLLPAPPGVLAHTRRIVVLAACCAAGYGWAALMAGVRLADALPAEWEGRDIRIEGVIAGLPQPSERSVRFEFDVERVLETGAVVPGRVVLSWWGSPAQDGRPATPPLQRYLEANAPMSAASAPARSSLQQSESGALPSLSPGERWQLTVRLRRPHGMANPHGFDYEAWLLERNLRATGHVRPRTGAVRLAALVHRPHYWVERARAMLRARILAALPDRPYAGVLVALAVGDQRAIPPDQWQVYTRTGVNHLMSISGLHVTMVSGLVFALAYGLWRRSPRLAARLPAAKAAAIAGLATAFGYALLAGFAVPAQRTVYMLCVVAAAVWLGAVGSSSAVLAAALLIVLLLDPWAVLSPGFWLSFGAVGVIMFV
jgi:competence protein ComEC